METDRKCLYSWNNEIVKEKENKINIKNFRNLFYIFFTIIIILNFIFFSNIFIRNKIILNNIYKNINITYLIDNITKSIKNKISSNDIECKLVENMLKSRTQPFDFENELLFFTNLISCKIPFSFIRFGDGENSIMKGIKLNAKVDKWYFNPKNKKFQESLIKSSSICINHNSFIGIPCKNWIKVSKSILSFSKCSNAKYMTYATLFINKNYPFFKEWILHFINSSKRWKIILVANSIIHKNIEWAYKFYPIPDHLIENWNKYSISLLSQLSIQAKQNDLIFFISAGPAANIIISYLNKINNNNIYIDFGSSIEFITKGYTTRPYAKTGKASNHRCEPFFLKNKSLIYIG